MADSTHILKLKATLDTSEVKSKLDQLRQVQQQALGNNQNSGNAPSQGVGGNLTQLTSTLNRLNTTMMQMQRTLSQLAVGNKIHQYSSSVSPLPPMVLTAQTQTQNKSADLIKNFINKTAGKSILDFAREGRLDGLEKMYKSTPTDWATRYFQTQLTPASAGIDFEAWKNWMSKKDVQKQFELQFINPELNDKRNRAISNFQMLKPIGGLAIHQGASMIGNFARQNGDNTTAFAASALGKIGSYAMMGSVAGPWGTAIGVAIGSVETLFDYFTENAKEAQKELEDWNRNIERSQTFKKTYDEVKDTRTLNYKISKAVKTDDVARLQAMADQIQKKIDLNSKFLEGQREGAEYGDTAENIMDIFNQQEKRISQLEHIKSLIDQINEKKKKEAEIQKQINERNKKEAEIKAQIEKKNLDNYRNQANILKQSYKWEEEANQNNAEITLGTYDYNTLGDKYNTYRKKYLEFKNQYEKNLDNAENAGTSELANQFLDIASRMKDAMNFNKSQMDLFGGSQLEMLNNLLSKIKAPDMTNVTSLASQGLMTFGKDDQLIDLQVDYMKQQLDVQKQIKDKMREHVEFE